MKYDVFYRGYTSAGTLRTWKNSVVSRKPGASFAVESIAVMDIVRVMRTHHIPSCVCNFFTAARFILRERLKREFEPRDEPREPLRLFNKFRPTSPS